MSYRFGARPGFGSRPIGFVGIRVKIIVVVPLLLLLNIMLLLLLLLLLLIIWQIGRRLMSMILILLKTKTTAMLMLIGRRILVMVMMVTPVIHHSGQSDIFAQCKLGLMLCSDHGSMKLVVRLLIHTQICKRWQHIRLA